MTRTEHLLAILAEECAEVSQRATKALRFGLDERQPAQPFNNAERLVQEWCDLRAAFEMLVDEGAVELYDDDGRIARMIGNKRDQVEHFLRYSAELGTLDGTP